MSALLTRIDDLSRELAALLEQSAQRIVFAESCTAGLACASLARNAGISKWLCGSAVTYREATKTAWLDVDATRLEEETAVSRFASNAMVIGALAATPEATLAASITGHLGPDAPPELDGVCFVAVSLRNEVDSLDQKRIQLTNKSRIDRQWEAVEQLFQFLIAFLRQRLASKQFDSE